MVVKFCGVVLIVTMAAACTVSVDKVPSPVYMKSVFSDSGRAQLPDKWWLAFNDEALNRLCEKALNENFSLSAVYHRLDQAKAIAKKSGADLIPNVDGSLSSVTSSAGSSAFNDFVIGLAASYELDLWGRIRSSVNAAELDVNSAQEDIDAAAISLTAEIADTWYRLIEQRQQLKLLEQQIEINRNNVALVTVRFRGSQASAADVFQQQQLLESVIGTRYAVLANLEVLENQLVVLTGSSPRTYELPDTNVFPSLPPLPSTGLSSRLMQRRPDIRKAYFAVQAADQRIASAIADRYPKFSLSANAEIASPNFQSLLNNWLATIAGNVVLPVIDGRRRVAEIERTRAVSAEALSLYAAGLLKAANEVENALVQERQQKSVVENLERQVQLAQQASSLIRLRYINGAMDFLRVLSALLSQQSLERNLLQSRQQLLSYRISLYRALAGRFPLPGPREKDGKV